MDDIWTVNTTLQVQFYCASEQSCDFLVELDDIWTVMNTTLQVQLYCASEQSCDFLAPPREGNGFLDSMNIIIASGNICCAGKGCELVNKTRTEYNERLNEDPDLEGPIAPILYSCPTLADAFPPDVFIRPPTSSPTASPTTMEGFLLQQNDNLQQEIDQLEQENDQLEQELEALREEKTGENDNLQQENAQLEQELEALREEKTGGSANDNTLFMAGIGMAGTGVLLASIAFVVIVRTAKKPKGLPASPPLTVATAKVEC